MIIRTKNICFGSDYHVYRAEIMRFKPWFRLKWRSFIVENGLEQQLIWI